MDAAVSTRTSLHLWMLLLLAGTLVLTGCKGCTNPLASRDDKKAPDLDELEKKKKEKEKPKEDFEFKPATIVPGDADETRSFVKPGHWVTVQHEIKANNFDFQAELHTRATDSAGAAIDIEHTPFQISSSRPAILPKGQDKVFETTYFLPVIKQTDQLIPKSVWLQRELRARGGRLVKEDVRQGTVAMPSYQYHFIVLSDEPSRFGYLKSLTAFTAPTGSEVDTDKLNYYRVHAPKINKFAPLPSHALTWTSVAYVLWDDVGPQILTPAQQEALIDWLHFGGQLIISGPNSLEKLRGSYLDPFLPAKAGATIPVAQSSIDELNNFWSLKDARSGEKKTLNVLPGKPMLAVELTPLENSTAVPNTGNLVIERRVGAGRIAVTAFSLGDPRFLSWGSIDSFVNGAILRRPRRRFEARDLMPETLFADYHPSLIKDSRLSSTLRFFSRDIDVFATTKEGKFEAVAPTTDAYPGLETQTDQNVNYGGFPRYSGVTGRYRPSDIPRPTGGDVHPEVDDWHLRGFRSSWRTSMAAWNDRSGAANAARQSLKDAAGISIPKGEFVLKVLAVYLAVLAPLNWLIFKLIGRVEWAWISAPLIAIIGTFAVVRLAQLDIGFARSMTEIAIIEAHGDYSRAHATRYSALYTSLSTSYDMEFEDDGSLALPFAAGEYQRGLHDSVYTVTMRRDKQLRLSGFLVPSNTTGTVHCEQLTDLGGAFSLVGSDATGWQIKNGSNFALKNTGVLRKTESGKYEGAWIGELRAKSSVPLKFEPTPDDQPHLTQWDDVAETKSYDVQVRELLRRLDENGDQKIDRREARAESEVLQEFSRIDLSGSEQGDGMLDREELVRWSRLSRAGEVSLGQLYELASKGLRLMPGEIRLIGLTADVLPGVKVQPAAAQETHRTMFLVHLRQGNLPVPQPDVNLLTDVAEIKPENEPESNQPVPPTNSRPGNAAATPAAPGSTPGTTP